MLPSTKEKTFDDVIEETASFFGGIPKMAKALKVTRNAIYQWRDAGIPEGRAFQIQVITDGKIQGAQILDKQKSRSINGKH